MSRNSRLIAALVCAPFAASVLTAGLIAVVVGAGSGGNSLHFSAAQVAVGQFVLWLFYIAPLSIALSSTVGLFWHARMQRIGNTHLLAYAVPAALAGAFVPALLVSLLALAVRGSLVVLLAAVPTAFAGAIVGGLTGLFAWLIRRPDRDAPANPVSTAS